MLGLGWWGQTRHVLLPAALPGFLAGLRQGWAFSWRSLMAAELIVTSSKLGFGLGQLMNQGRDLSDAPLLYAGLILIFVVGVGVELILFRPLERAILDARGLSTKKRVVAFNPEPRGVRTSGSLLWESETVFDR